MISSVSDLTIAPNAAPMMTPTAKSITLPLAMKALKSDSMLVPLEDALNHLLALCADAAKPFVLRAPA
jgi:hypothetical protein